MGGGGFWAFIIWSFLLGSVMWAIGNDGFDTQVAKDCDAKNEVTLSGTVYQCKPVALFINGRRAELK